MTIELPPAVPSNRPGGPITATWSKTRPNVATTAPRNRSGGWSITFWADAPVAQHLRDLSDELPCRQVPGDRPAAEGVADDEICRLCRQRGNVAPGVTDAHPQSWAELEAELVLGELDDSRIELEHHVVGARPGGLHVARHREPAAADVHGVDPLAGSVECVDDVAE